MYFTWPNLSKFNIGHSFTKLIQRDFQHPICIKNQQTKSISKFCCDYFFDTTLGKNFLKGQFSRILALLCAHFLPKKCQKSIKIFEADVDLNKLFLLEMNTFLFVFSKKQHRGTPKPTHTQELASEAHNGKSRFWAL